MLSPVNGVLDAYNSVTDQPNSMSNLQQSINQSLEKKYNSVEFAKIKNTLEIIEKELNPNKINSFYGVVDFTLLLKNDSFMSEDEFIGFLKELKNLLKTEHSSFCEFLTLQNELLNKTTILQMLKIFQLRSRIFSDQFDGFLNSLIEFINRLEANNNLQIKRQVDSLLDILLKSHNPTLMLNSFNTTLPSELFTNEKLYVYINLIFHVVRNMRLEEFQGVFEKLKEYSEIFKDSEEYLKVFIIIFKKSNDKDFIEFVEEFNIENLKNRAIDQLKNSKEFFNILLEYSLLNDNDLGNAKKEDMKCLFNLVFNPSTDEIFDEIINITKSISSQDMRRKIILLNEVLLSQTKNNKSKTEVYVRTLLFTRRFFEVFSNEDESKVQLLFMNIVKTIRGEFKERHLDIINILEKLMINGADINEFKDYVELILYFSQLQDYFSMGNLLEVIEEIFDTYGAQERRELVQNVSYLTNNRIDSEWIDIISLWAKLKNEDKENIYEILVAHDRNKKIDYNKTIVDLIKQLSGIKIDQRKNYFEKACLYLEKGLDTQDLFLKDEFEKEIIANLAGLIFEIRGLTRTYFDCKKLFSDHYAEELKRKMSEYINEYVDDIQWVNEHSEDLVDDFFCGGDEIIQNCHNHLMHALSSPKLIIGEKKVIITTMGNYLKMLKIQENEELMRLYNHLIASFGSNS